MPKGASDKWTADDDAIMADQQSEAKSMSRISEREQAIGIPTWWSSALTNYGNSMVSGNEFGSLLPQVSDDAGTPFAVVVIPVDEKLAIKARPK